MSKVGQIGLLPIRCVSYSTLTEALTGNLTPFAATKNTDRTGGQCSTLLARSHCVSIHNEQTSICSAPRYPSCDVWWASADKKGIARVRRMLSIWKSCPEHHVVQEEQRHAKWYVPTLPAVLVHIRFPGNVIILVQYWREHLSLLLIEDDMKRRMDQQFLIQFRTPSFPSSFPTGEEEITSPSLTIENMDRHKGGTYICTADNGVGQAATSLVVLHVLCEYPSVSLRHVMLLVTVLLEKPDLQTGVLKYKATSRITFCHHLGNTLAVIRSKLMVSDCLW